MGASRENKNIWIRLVTRYPGGQWMGWALFHRRFWSDWKMIWHDSFGRYLWSWFICRWFGHGFVRNIADCVSDPDEYYCFNCETFLGSEDPNG